MRKHPNGHCLDWSRTASYMIESQALEASSVPSFERADGRDLPDADLDALAEAIFANLAGTIAEKAV